MKALARGVWRWLTATGPLARIARLSWYSHLGVTIAMTLIPWRLGLFINQTVADYCWLAGATFAVGFYLRKEVLDLRKYGKDHRLAEVDESGVSRLSDSYGDALGPISWALCSWLAWFLW